MGVTQEKGQEKEVAEETGVAKEADEQERYRITDWKRKSVQDRGRHGR